LKLERLALAFMVLGLTVTTVACSSEKITNPSNRSDSSSAITSPQNGNENNQVIFTSPVKPLEKTKD